MPTFEDTYNMGDNLGNGGFASVFRCTHQESGDTRAVKVIDKSKGEAYAASAECEGEMMRAVGHHPNVIQLHEVFDTPEATYLVLDFVNGGTLFDRLKRIGPYSEGTAPRLIKNLLIGLQHVHGSDVIHRDLKPDNLLLRQPRGTDVIIADFGLACAGPGKSFSGTLAYTAPEVIRVGLTEAARRKAPLAADAAGDLVPFDNKCDLWSVGVIVFNMLTGKQPWRGGGDKDTLIKDILSGNWHFSDKHDISDAAKDFISGLLTVDPTRRLSAEAALAHPWIAGVSSEEPVKNDAAPAEPSAVCCAPRRKSRGRRRRGTWTLTPEC